MNCYWQMPFRKRALITLENQSYQDADIVAYSVLYNLHDVSEDTDYFHAQWRRTLTTRDYPEHVIVDRVQGRGVRAAPVVDHRGPIGVDPRPTGHRRARLASAGAVSFLPSQPLGLLGPVESFPQ